MNLANSRSHFSALTLTDSVCLPGPIPAHSCPTLDGGTCVFPFTNGKQSTLAKCSHGIFPQDQKLTLPVSVEITKASGVQLQQKDGPSVTLGNALLKEVTLQKFVKILYQISKINQSSIANMVFYAYSILQVNKYTLYLDSKCLCFLLRLANRGGCLAGLERPLPRRLQCAKHGKLQIWPCHLPHPRLEPPHCNMWGLGEERLSGVEERWLVRRRVGLLAS